MTDFATDEHGCVWIKGNGHLCGDVMEQVRMLNAAHAESVKPIVQALEKLRDCDWTIGRGDRMDAVRDIAKKALEDFR